jgi:hypothetical protein
MGLASTVKVVITGDASGARKALKEVQKDSHETGGFLGKLGKVATSGYAAIATATIAAGSAAVKFAMDEQNSHAKLVVSLKNSGQSWAANSKMIESADKAGEHFGYTSADTESVLAQLETSTGSTTKSIKLLGLAQNLAAETGKPLADAAIAVTKASQGQLRPLKMLGIDLPIAAGGALKTKTAFEKLGKAQDALAVIQAKIHAGTLKGTAAHSALEKALHTVAAAQTKFTSTQHAGSNIIDALSKKLKGQAAAAADTFAGKMKALKAEGVDFAAKVGAKIIPILISLAKFFTDTVIPAMGKVVSWVEDNWPRLRDAIVPVLQKIQGYISGFVHTVQHLWSQFGGRIVSFAKKYFGSLKMEISGALEVIKSVFRVFADILTGKWGKLWGDILGIFKGLWKIVKGAIGIAWTEITSVISLAWDGIKNLSSNAIGAVVGFITSIPGKLLGLAGDFLSAGTALGGHILSGIVSAISGAASAVGNIASQIWGAFKGFLNNDLIGPANNVLGNISVLGYHPFGKSTFPMLAEGGIVTGPMMAMIGERGPEAVIPLSDKRRANEVLGLAGLGNHHSSSNSKVVNITINAPKNADAREIVAELTWAAKTGGY